MSLSSDIARFQVKVDASVKRAVELISIDLYNRIVEKTPIDTGLAKANWNLSVGTVDTSTTNSLSIKNRAGIVGLSLTGDDILYISNHLHYIYELEHGKSGQAPAGMVLVSIPETINWVNSKLGIA